MIAYPYSALCTYSIPTITNIYIEQMQRRALTRWLDLLCD